MIVRQKVSRTVYALPKIKNIAITVIAPAEPGFALNRRLRHGYNISSDDG